ncbi:amidohydrolase, partial [Streptomyces sp. NPDC004976]
MHPPSRPARTNAAPATSVASAASAASAGKQPAAAHLLARAGDVLRPALALYLDLHAHPERSGQEARTADRFGRRLAAAGCEVTHGVGG